MKIILLALLVFTKFIYCQTSTDDFFPLSIGNSWTYNYQTSSSDLVNGFYSSDSGTAIYSITSKFISNDSTIWNCQEIRDIIFRFSQSFPPHTSEIDTIKDTTEFPIVEYPSGNHRLVKYGDSNLFSVFPFTEEFQDSISFFRYFPSVVLDTFSINVQSVYEYYYNYSVSFQRSIGLTKVSFYINPALVGYDASTNHTLQSAVITSVNNQDLESLPKDFELLQNYPNPFNPTTMIQYYIPNESKIKIQVFDLLGNQIETIVDNLVQAGNHSLGWNAIDRASGVYICVLQAEEISKSIKIVLLK